MLGRTRRKDRVSIFTLDRALATDIQERISCDPRMRDYTVVRPQSSGTTARIAEIESMARHTVFARLLILDVRSYTLGRLQQAYNKTVGYNRRDLNCSCHIMLIGDGPLNLFHAGKSLDVFLPHLASHRKDYHPAVFFYDPFLHYTHDERQAAGIDQSGGLPRAVPKRLAKGFKQDNPTMETVRRYFRAASVAPEKRQEAKEERQGMLVRLFKKRIAEEFPHHKERVESWLGREGYSLAGEALRLHIYPLFFEDWVFELIEKGK